MQLQCLSRACVVSTYSLAVLEALLSYQRIIRIPASVFGEIGRSKRVSARISVLVAVALRCCYASQLAMAVGQLCGSTDVDVEGRFDGHDEKRDGSKGKTSAVRMDSSAETSLFAQETIRADDCDWMRRVACTAHSAT